MGNQIPWMEGLSWCLFDKELFFFLVLKINRYVRKWGHWYFTWNCRLQRLKSPACNAESVPVTFFVVCTIQNIDWFGAGVFLGFFLCVLLLFKSWLRTALSKINC